MKYSNPAFEKALVGLTHPLSLAAMTLLLVNDTVLRRFWPGLWTGKLGDVAWLIFVPYLLAAGLAWLIPQRWQGAPSGRRVFTLALLLTGSGFSLLKTVPALNLLATRILRDLTGIRPSLVFDPSDLLALPALAISLWVYLRAVGGPAKTTAPAHIIAPARFTASSWVKLAVLPLAALICLGDAAAPDLGFSCFEVTPGQIVARTGYESYQSTDGGLHWQAGQPGSSASCASRPSEPGQWQEVPGPQATARYRYQSGVEIQQSADGGQTWQTGYRLQPVSEAERIYYVRLHSGNPIFTPGPTDAAADPATGNMLFAMGLQGVLIHTAQGQWVWGQSGAYQPPTQFPNSDAFIVILGGMLILAVALAALIYAALALRWTRRWPRILVLTLAALAWLIVTLLFPPATSDSYASTISAAGILVTAVLVIPLAIEQTIRLVRRAPKAIPRLFLAGLVGGLLFMLPYVLWLYDLLPDFFTATIVSLILAGIVLIVGIFSARALPRWSATAASILLVALLMLVTLTGCGSAQTSQPKPVMTLVPTITLFQPPPSETASAVTAAPTQSITPAAGAPRPAAGLISAVHRGGQTFITWAEQANLHGERYRIYRSNQPIKAATLASAARLAEVGKNSARFYGNRFIDGGKWKSRYADRLIIAKNAAPLETGTGLLVWTVAPEDFKGKTGGAGYYAVTVIPQGGKESLLAGYTVGPVKETVSDPLPVEITHSPGMDPGPDAHNYIQFMDLRHWNPTFHAPNPSNQYFGIDPKDPDSAAPLAYAYDYQVFTPSKEVCGGEVPDSLPVMLFLHGKRDNRYGTQQKYPYPYCAYGVYPIDQSETWYFGFAKNHDYRLGGEVGAGDVIENYTEQRVLRMVYDLMRQPPGPAVDQQRVYVFGHSMGGSGTLALVQRYPNVFAAGYSGEPISDYRTSGVTKSDWPKLVSLLWGAPELNLPIHITAPGKWAERIGKFNGTGVWDWQNYQMNLSTRFSDEVAPFAVDHGLNDDVILYSTQGQVFYPLLNERPLPWAGLVTGLEHDWSIFLALPPSMAMVDKVPFWNLQVKRSETVPGFSHLSSNLRLPPTTPAGYNQTIKWSASWNAWDGAPTDQKDLWKMSFCAVAPTVAPEKITPDTVATQAAASPPVDCGSGVIQTVDITPRRLQHFVVKPGAQYNWENRQVSGNRLTAHGTVAADASGLLTIPAFQVSPSGSRLIIRPHQ